ncbi:MAG: SRPBCC family protein [Caulobacteraceae bacterium]
MRKGHDGAKFVLLAVFIGVSAVSGVRAGELDPAARSALARGQAWADVAPGADGAGLIRAMVDIAAPPRLVWRVMTDCAYAARLVSTVTSCRVLKSDPAGAWDIREQVTRGGLFFPPMRNVFRSDYRPYSEIRFHRVAGDLKIEEGFWRLDPLPGGAGTRVSYVNRVAANLIAPAFVVRMGMKQSTPKVMMNLKRTCQALVAGGGGRA